MFTNPEQNISQLNITPGMRVADIGAGTGFYSLLLAKLVGNSGKVYAIDIQKDLLEKLKAESRKDHLLNIDIVWGDMERLGGSKLGAGVADVAILSNILFQIKDKNTFLLETKRILKPGGRVMVVDWTDSFGGMGPQSKDVLNEMMAKELFDKNGFSIERSFFAGDHHYGLIFKKI